MSTEEVEIRGEDSDDRGAEALTHSLWPHCSQCAQKVRKRRPAQTAAAAGKQERRFTHCEGEGILSKPGGPVCPDRLLFLGCEDPLRGSAAPLVVGD